MDAVIGQFFNMTIMASALPLVLRGLGMTLVVCAVIENGGHGGIAAAPAALRVFEQYFKTHATTTSHISD